MLTVLVSDDSAVGDQRDGVLVRHGLHQGPRVGRGGNTLDFEALQLQGHSFLLGVVLDYRWGVPTKRWK